MRTKITTLEQTGYLKVGDKIRKFPTRGLPEKSYDETNIALMEIYDIKSLNVDHKIVGLVIAPESRIQFASPGDITRIFISQANLITEDSWWI